MLSAALSTLVQHDNQYIYGLAETVAHIVSSFIPMVCEKTLEVFLVEFNGALRKKVTMRCKSSSVDSSPYDHVSSPSRPPPRLPRLSLRIYVVVNLCAHVSVILMLCLVRGDPGGLQNIPTFNI